MKTVFLRLKHTNQYGEETKTVFSLSGGAYRVILPVLLALASVVTLLAVQTTAVSAATSSTLNFQGRLLTNTGGLVPDGSYNIEFKMYDDEFAGSNVWTENRTGGGTVTIRNGYFSVYLGDVTPFGASIPWDQDLWITMNVNTDGEMTPRFKLSAVPYAFRAGAVMDSAGNAYTGDDLIQKAPSTVQAVNSALAAIRLNQAGAGGLLELQKNAVNKFTVDNDGNTVLAGSITVNGSQLINNGATLNTALALGDLAAGPLSVSPTTTVDIATNFTISPTASGRTYTIPSPTNTTAGRIIYISNINATNSFAVGSITFLPGTSAAYLWNGIDWVSQGSAAATGSFVNLQATTPGTAQTGNLNLTGTGIFGGGITASGATNNLNTSSNFATNINTGTSTGAVNVGNSAAGIISLQSGSNINITGTTSVTGRTTGDAFTVNNSTSTGAILNLQDNGSQVVTVANEGATTFKNVTNSSNAFQIQNAAGTNLLNVDSLNSLVVSNANFEASGYVNSAFGGFGKYSNLLTCSEQFGVAGCGSWNSSNALMFANFYTAPDGTQTAAALTDQAIGGLVTQTTSTAPTNANYTFSVWLRRTAGSGTMDLRIDGATSGTGTIASFPSDTTWRRYTVTQNTNGFTGNIKVTIYPGGVAGSGTVAAWGAQLVLGSDAQVYVNTTLSTVAATNGLTSNGNALIQNSSGTTALTVRSVSTGNGQAVSLTNTTGTQTVGLSVDRNGAGGTTTTLLSLSNTAGTVTNGILFSGTVGTDITTTSGRGLSIITGGAGILTLDTETTGSIAIGTNNNAKIINIGNGNGANAIRLGGAGANTIDIGNTQNAGSINIGSALTSGTISIGGTAAQTGTISLGTGTGAQTINLATGAGAKSLIIGSNNSTSGTTINAGSNGISLNANTTIGSASTNRLTVTSQILGASPLTFQGATDNTFSTIISLVDPTANNTITLPNASGTVAVSASGNIALNSAGNISLTGQVGIANGGTGAINQQDAINALSGLTTNGDLLYFNGTNSTRLARGGNGECLTSNVTTLVWASCTTGAVTSIGGINTQTKSANGAVLASGALVLQTADATNVGLVSATGSQTFGGDKTFNGQIIGGAGLTVDGGSVSLNVTGTNTTSIGNATGTLTLIGNSSSIITVNGTSIDATELSLLDGRNAALVDSNDAVATAITGTGALASGSIGGSFGNINIGTNIFTGNGSGLTTLNGTNISSGTISNSYLTGSGALTVTAGTGLGGGGSVALGSSISLNVAYGSAAGTAVQGDTSLVCASGSGNLTGGGNTITLGSGGTCNALSTNNAVSFTTSVTTPIITSTSGLSITSGGSGDITLNSASNITILDATDTTLRRTATGTYSIELNDGAATTLALNNTSAGEANLNLIDGSLQTAGILRLNNSGSLENITGLTITSGGANVTGLSTFASGTNFNANVTIGDATTDRLTFTSQVLGSSPLTFQGATDNGFSTTLSLNDPTANNTITLPDISGTVALIAPTTAQIDNTTDRSLFINKTGASGNIIELQNTGSAVFTVGNSGALQIQSTSTTALDIRDAGGTSFFSVDSSTGIVRIGPTGADNVGVLFVLDTKNLTGDPAIGANDNAQYYNSQDGKFRCYENGVWRDCIEPINNVPLMNMFNTTAAATNLALNTLNCVSDPSLRMMMNLNGQSRLRFMARIGGTINAATTIRLQYHLGGNPAIATGDAGWNTLATSAGGHTLNTLFYTAESAIPAGARANDVLVRACLFSGNGTADPTITGVTINTYD